MCVSVIKVSLMTEMPFQRHMTMKTFWQHNQSSSSLVNLLQNSVV